jgi:hypothetical protein
MEDLRQSTSTLALHWAETTAAFETRLKERLDHGQPPAFRRLPGLRPVRDLSLGEAEWLAAQIPSSLMLTGTPRPERLKSRIGKEFPGALARRGELAFFHYGPADREYLMTLVRHPEGWRVLEPAIPLLGSGTVYSGQQGSPNFPWIIGLALLIGGAAATILWLRHPGARTRRRERGLTGG